MQKMSAHITQRHDEKCVDAFISHITLSRSLSLTRVIRKWRSRMLFKSHKQRKHILPWESCPLFLAGSCCLLSVCFCFQGCGSPGANLAVRATWAGLCSEQSLGYSSSVFQVDRGVSEGLSAELVRESTWWPVFTLPHWRLPLLVLKGHSCDLWARAEAVVSDTQRTLNDTSRRAALYSQLKWHSLLRGIDEESSAYPSIPFV
jgi:hypothetical protein